jgi:hypothetical protein
VPLPIVRKFGCAISVPATVGDSLRFGAVKLVFS